MSQFNLKEFSKKRFQQEKLTLGPHTLKASLNCYTGVQGEFWVSIVPSLNVSGYGTNEEEARESLKENMDVFCEDLFNLKPDRRMIELNKLGWHSGTFFKKRLSSSFVDENGVLQGFDHPEQVKKNILETV